MFSSLIHHMYLFLKKPAPINLFTRYCLYYSKMSLILSKESITAAALP